MSGRGRAGTGPYPGRFRVRGLSIQHSTTRVYKWSPRNGNNTHVSPGRVFFKPLLANVKTCSEHGRGVPETRSHPRRGCGARPPRVWVRGCRRGVGRGVGGSRVRRRSRLHVHGAGFWSSRRCPAPDWYTRTGMSLKLSTSQRAAVSFVVRLVRLYRSVRLRSGTSVPFVPAPVSGVRSRGQFPFTGCVPEQSRRLRLRVLGGVA
jgi:hypothetical protein